MSAWMVQALREAEALAEGFEAGDSRSGCGGYNDPATGEWTCPCPDDAPSDAVCSPCEATRWLEKYEGLVKVLPSDNEDA